MRAKVPVLSMFEREIPGYNALWRVTGMRLRGEHKFVNVRVDEVDDFEKRLAPGATLSAIDKAVVKMAFTSSLDAISMPDESSVLEVSAVLNEKSLPALDALSAREIAAAFVEWVGKTHQWNRYGEAREWLRSEQALALWVRAYEIDAYSAYILANDPRMK